MRKVVVAVEVTLNGVMSPVDWAFQFMNEERGKYARDLLFASDALLMGRETYEVFANFWPARTSADDGPGEEGFNHRINSLPKYVASTTLKEPLGWNATLIRGDIAEEVAKLKQQPGQDILMYGAGRLAHTLMQHGLVDELRVWVYPVLWESGIRLLNDASDLPALRLMDTKVFSSGLVVLTYQPEKKE